MLTERCATYSVKSSLALGHAKGKYKHTGHSGQCIGGGGGGPLYTKHNIGRFLSLPSLLNSSTHSAKTGLV